MQNKTVGSNLNLLFVGYVISLVVNLLTLVGMTGGLVSMCSLVGLVVIMVALNHLKGCHPGYGKALQYEIILIVFAVISAVLLVVIAFLSVLQWLLWPIALLISIGSILLNYFVVRYVSLSTADLVGDAGDLNTAALGAQVNKIYLVCCAVGVVCTVLGLIPLLGSIFNLLGKLASLATIAGLGLLVYFLYRAKTCLS